MDRAAPDEERLDALRVLIALKDPRLPEVTSAVAAEPARWSSYNKTIISKFKGPGEPDILIVVDKLLTGFDAPRNTVLYMARPLREHGLLQAIARVNRVFDEDGAARADGAAVPSL